MKPHMEYIKQTLIKKKQATESPFKADGVYLEYMMKVNKARIAGFADLDILSELEKEKETILTDLRGIMSKDQLYEQAHRNVKVECLSALNRVIDEIKKDLEPHRPTFKGDN